MTSPGEQGTESAISDLRYLLSPRSIAIIGASADPNRLSGRPLSILQQHGFQGPIYPVNPRHQSVGGLPAYASIAEVPGPVDVAAVVLPAGQVLDAVGQCAAAGVRSVAVFSSGFAEESEPGRQVQEELAGVARSSGMRVLGPNAEGFFNLSDRIPLTFSPTVDYERGLRRLIEGNVAVVSQSGGLGFALFNWGQAVGLGFSQVVSTGNEADLGALEVTRYLLEDPATDVIALLVEGFGADEDVAVAATRAAELGKPLVVAKLGRSIPGREAAAAHTAHHARDDDEYQEAFRRLGVVSVTDQEDLLDACFALSRGRVARGNRVAIVTTSGGAGVWLADACQAAGLSVPELDESLQQQLRPLMPSYGSARNPVDVTAEIVNRAGVAEPLGMLLSSPQVDAVVLGASLAGPQMLDREAAEIAGVMASTTKPLVVYPYTYIGEASVDALARLGLPWFPSPARVAKALSVLARVGERGQGGSPRL